MRDGRDPVDDACREHHGQRVQRLVGQRKPPQRLEQDEPRRRSDREADGHLAQELPHDAGEPGVGVEGDLDHPDHQRDPDRVVESGLSLQDRARATLHLLPGEDGERHRRVRRCERRTDQERDGPVEAEHVVGGDGDERGRAERAEDADDRDRDGRGPEPPEADAHAAVEEDRDQRQRRHPLDVLEREEAREPVGDVCRQSRDDEEQRGRGEAEPGGGDADDDRERQRAGDDQDDAREVDDAVHVRILPAGRDSGRRRARATANTFLTGVSLQPHPGRRYLGRMRLAALILLVLGLSATVATGAAKAPGGTLLIEDGRGTVQITGKGVLVGRMEKGSLEITDLNPTDQWSPRVNGIPRGKVVTLRGKNVSFYVPGGRYRLVARGTGISISARGTGTVVLDGDPDAVGGTGRLRDRRRGVRAAARRSDEDVLRGGRGERAVVPISQDPAMTAPQTILVVEDETAIASFVALYLKNAGYNVKAVGTGGAALNAIAAEAPALIILDLNLPDMDGLEICRRVRKSSDVPILMLTARDEDVDKIIGLEVGCGRLPDEAVQPARARRAREERPAPLVDSTAAGTRATRSATATW